MLCYFCHMYKTLLPLVFLLTVIISCVEEDPDLRGTAPLIGFSFYDSTNVLYPDSVMAAGADSIYIFTDSLNVYPLPLRNDLGLTEFTFYLDSIVSEVAIEYEVTPTYDIDMIRHDAILKNAIISNIDSVLLVQDNEILCTTVSSSTGSVALNCGDTLNLNTNETTLRLYF